MNTTKTTQTFPVLDMSCAACATRVEKTLNRQPGVYHAQVNYAAATATVEYNPQECTPETLKDAIQNAGYDLVIETNAQKEKIAEDAHSRKYRQLKQRTIFSLMLSVPVAIIGMCFMDWTYANYVMWILSTPLVFWLGRDFYRNAWKQLKHRTSNMDTLVAVSTGIAYTFSLFNLFWPEFWLSRGIHPHVYFEAASVIISFILLGRLLEEKAKGNTSEAIKKLMGLQPATVTILTPEGQLKEIPVEQVQQGQRLVVKPGSRIAVDGTVYEGSSYVDESMLTGEPLPTEKTPGAKVYAGTINQKGSFSFIADKVGSETVLAHIIRMVQDAQGSKAPVQKLVDKIAGIFVPVIIGIALLTFGLWCLFAPTAGFSHGLLAMITVLIIACPCALGLATPTALIVGIGKGAEHGILIKDATSLEIARKIDTIVLDKTGTITEGHPRVVNTYWHTETTEARKIIYSLERLSEHPLAEAIVREFGQETSIPVTGFETIPGKGIKGRTGDETYYAGTAELLTDNGVILPEPLKQRAESWLKEAKTVVWFGHSTQALAIIAITDEIKPTSLQAIRQMEKIGLTVYMLTGDNVGTAQAIARKANIGHYRSGVLPHDKAIFIEQLQQKGARVAMVGDGINDSAALAQADLSIAMGKGSDIAMETAMVTILSSDLLKIPETIRLSRLTVKTIRQNLFWAFIYNLVSIPIAAGILYPVCGFLLNPMIGGAAMAFSSVSVVSNSLRLKRKKISLIPRGNEVRIEEVEPINKKVMKKRFTIDGMMCGHCRAHVEKALNSIDGVKAIVTLDPPEATIEFTDKEFSLNELQQVIQNKAGDYKLHDLE